MSGISFLAYYFHYFPFLWERLVASRNATEKFDKIQFEFYQIWYQSSRFRGMAVKKVEALEEKLD